MAVSIAFMCLSAPAAHATSNQTAATDIIGGCPSETVVPSRANTDAIERAARSYATSVLGWPEVTVTSSYRVGAKGTYSEVYSYNIPRNCGRKTARASFGVDVANPRGDWGSSSRAALVVAHFADGWKVWGRFYN